MLISLNCISEDKPGVKWQEVFNNTWPYYKNWFLVEGYKARVGYLTSSENLKHFMPELFPIYEQLNELSGGSDLAARYLSMYCPPPYLSGCSQLAWIKDSVSLIRNYDYSPKMFEGVMLHSNWLQPVIGISDCNWGLLDGLNGSGLSASLTFGGREVTGIGFGIPLVIRYILETCDSITSAIEKLKYIPVHMTYNVTLLDKNHNYATVFLSPDREIIITKDQAATNHQQTIEWYDYAARTDTVERKEFLNNCLKDPNLTQASILKNFLKHPLYHPNFNKGYITLYTSMYCPIEMTASIHWPKKSITQSFTNFNEHKSVINISNTLTNSLIE